MHAVVEQDVDQVRRCVGADGGEGAELHQRRAVAVQHHHRPRGVEGDAEPHAARPTHGADLVEMLRPVGEREELPAALARWWRRPRPPRDEPRNRSSTARAGGRALRMQRKVGAPRPAWDGRRGFWSSTAVPRRRPSP